MAAQKGERGARKGSERKLGRSMDLEGRGREWTDQGFAYIICPTVTFNYIFWSFVKCKERETIYFPIPHQHGGIF